MYKTIVTSIGNQHGTVALQPPRWGVAPAPTWDQKFHMYPHLSPLPLLFVVSLAWACKCQVRLYLHTYTFLSTWTVL